MTHYKNPTIWIARPVIIIDQLFLDTSEANASTSIKISVRDSSCASYNGDTRDRVPGNASALRVGISEIYNPARPVFFLMSTRVAIYARVHEIRDIPIALGRLAVAANMLKIIGLVALSIPDSEGRIDRLLIARIRSDARTMLAAPPRARPFFSHSPTTRRDSLCRDTWSTVAGESSVVESKWKFNIPSVFCPYPFSRHILILLSLCHPPHPLSLNPHYSNEHPGSTVLRAEPYYESRFVLLKNRLSTRGWAVGNCR